MDDKSIKREKQRLFKEYTNTIGKEMVFLLKSTIEEAKNIQEEL